MTTESDRGRVRPPDLDDRTWQDLVAEMLALRTTYAPQWTDDRPSDIGVTLVELFAWLGEGVIYRLNQVPEKNYIAFLDLMGITRAPATPAATYLTFGTKGPAPADVPAGTQAQTLPVEGDAPVVFETDEDLTVLPVGLTAALLLTPDPDDDSRLVYEDVTADLVGTGTGRRPVLVPPHLSTHVCLGFEDHVTGEIELRPRLFRAAPDDPAGTVTWAASVDGTQPGDWPVIGPSATTKDLHDGRVRLPVPAQWAAQNPEADWSDVGAVSGSFDAPRFWIGLRIANPGDTPLEIGLERVLFNTVPAHTALSIRSPQTLGESDGTPFQVFALRHRPLYRRPGAEATYADLEVQVGQGIPPVWETWQLVPELMPGAGKVYRLNPVTGEISFGSHNERGSEGHGSIPAPGSLVRARTYRHVASGAAGNVPSGKVVVVGTKPDGTVATGLTVTNLLAAHDGIDEEPTEDALRRAPERLKTRDRAITADDFTHLAREASSDVRISRCLTPYPSHGTPWTFGGIDRAPGNVSVIVVPDQGSQVAQPEPPPELIETVRAYLDARRDLTVRLFVHRPRYLPIDTKVSVKVWREAVLAGVDLTQVRNDVEQKIEAFLHPTRGGPDGRGWQVGQLVFSKDLFQAAMPPETVGYIEQITVTPGTPVYEPRDRPFPQPPAAGASVQVADYELVCAGAATVAVNQTV